MDQTADKKAPSPPYVAYKTFKNFLEKFKQGVPGRIDRDLMGTMSGAVQSQIVTTLRYLGMISENSLPLDPMKQFVVSEGEERKKILKSILSRAYPFLFDGHFNLATATASQLREEIESKTAATGETVTRCIAFFKDAATDAGVAVSPYIMQRKPRGSGGKKRNGNATKKSTEVESPINTNKPTDHSQSAHASIEAQKSLLLWGLFQRLPKPGSVWPKAERDQWTDTLQNVLALEYKEQ